MILPFSVSLFSRSHEEMSVRMVDHIVDEHQIEIDPEVLKRVKVQNFHQDIIFFSKFYNFLF